MLNVTKTANSDSLLLWHLFSSYLWEMFS